MKPIPETNITIWTPQEWPGNPSLNLECSCKLFNHYRNIPVFVWGKTGETFHYTVSAGANSGLSYSGLCVNCDNIQSAQSYIDSLSLTNKLFR